MKAHPHANGIEAVFDAKAKTKFTTSHRKERNGFFKEYTALCFDPDNADMRAVVTLRLYWPRETCYACIWVNGNGVHTSGSGKAGGGGYCKESAAAAYAIRNAGFRLNMDIDGRGTGRVRDAVLAIAHSLGFSEARIHVAHA